MYITITAALLTFTSYVIYKTINRSKLELLDNKLYNSNRYNIEPRFIPHTTYTEHPERYTYPGIYEWNERALHAVTYIANKLTNESKKIPLSKIEMILFMTQYGGYKDMINDDSRYIEPIRFMKKEHIQRYNYVVNKEGNDYIEKINYNHTINNMIEIYDSVKHLTNEYTTQMLMQIVDMIDKYNRYNNILEKEL